MLDTTIVANRQILTAPVQVNVRQAPTNKDAAIKPAPASQLDETEITFGLHLRVQPR